MHLLSKSALDCTGQIQIIPRFSEIRIPALGFSSGLQVMCKRAIHWMELEAALFEMPVLDIGKLFTPRPLLAVSEMTVHYRSPWRLLTVV